MHRLVPVYELGKWRTKPVFVNDPHVGKTIYLPPDARDEPKLVEELIDHITSNQDSVDPIILAGIFHKQFVIIHPFMDGNGRTTRLATKVLLAALGLDTFHLFSFENFYNQNVTKYFNEVGVKGNYYDIKDSLNFTSWLEYFTSGIIDELLRVEKILTQKSYGPETRLMPHHRNILEFIRKKGAITDRDYASFTRRAKATRTLDIKKLIDLGLISRHGHGRATYYTLKEK